jgi:hypothetical protein
LWPLSAQVFVLAVEVRCNRTITISWKSRARPK